MMPSEGLIYLPFLALLISSMAASYVFVSYILDMYTTQVLYTYITDVFILAQSARPCGAVRCGAGRTLDALIIAVNKNNYEEQE